MSVRPEGFQMGVNFENNCGFCEHLDIYKTQKRGNTFFCMAFRYRLPIEFPDETQICTCDHFESKVSEANQ